MLYFKHKGCYGAGNLWKDILLAVPWPDDNKNSAGLVSFDFTILWHHVQTSNMLSLCNLVLQHGNCLMRCLSGPSELQITLCMSGGWGKIFSETTHCTVYKYNNKVLPFGTYPRNWPWGAFDGDTSSEEKSSGTIRLWRRNNWVSRQFLRLDLAETINIHMMLITVIYVQAPDMYL